MYTSNTHSNTHACVRACIDSYTYIFIYKSGDREGNGVGMRKGRCEALKAYAGARAHTHTHTRGLIRHLALDVHGVDEKLAATRMSDSDE